MLQANVLDVWRKHFVLEENMLEVGLRHFPTQVDV
jgi:glycyl-tRNA synthetase (class II)